MKVLLCLITALVSGAAQAGSYEDSYCTTISAVDRQNSNGLRLTTVAQIIQNERANFHKNRHRDAGDQGDETFGYAPYRAALAEIFAPNSAGPILTDQLVNQDMPLDICVLLQGGDMPDLGMEIEIWRNE